MFIWKKESEEKEDWVLVNDNDCNDLGCEDVIASINVSENADGTCNVEAKCKHIGYTCRFDHLNKDKLKTIIAGLRKNVKFEINHLRPENLKPIDKKVYTMIGGIPIWKHLKNGAEEIKISLKANDYGSLTEILGNRILSDILQRGGIVDNLFPEIDIVSTHILKRFKVIDRAKVGIGDVVIEVDYKKDDKFGKKMVIFEIKHGKIVIEQNQLNRYCSMILKPEEYFHKADEVKIIYMMFDKIDTLNASAYYSIREIDKEFARTILERVPIGINHNGEISQYYASESI